MNNALPIWVQWAANAASLLGGLVSLAMIWKMLQIKTVIGSILGEFVLPQFEVRLKDAQENVKAHLDERLTEQRGQMEEEFFGRRLDDRIDERIDKHPDMVKHDRNLVQINTHLSLPPVPDSGRLKKQDYIVGVDQ